MLINSVNCILLQGLSHQVPEVDLATKCIIYKNEINCLRCRGLAAKEKKTNCLLDDDRNESMVSHMPIVAGLVDVSILCL